jgi:hypothetical protein
LYLAKKDSYLLELFVQNCEKSKLPLELIASTSAINIIERWIARVIGNNAIRFGDNVTKKQVQDMFTILNISQHAFLDFTQVAKVGAVVAAIHKNSFKLVMFDESISQNKSSRLCKRYSNMRSSKTVISYNSMGEKVITKIPLEKNTTFGIPRGYADDIRKFWNEEPSRVSVHVNEVEEKYPEAILKKIPQSLMNRLHRSVKLPKVWTPKLDHWFDVKRTIRIINTILDMRFSAQQEYVLHNGAQDIENVMKIDKDDDLSGMMITSLLIKCFERSYGGGDLHVAHQKVVNFLEAIYQYCDHPVVNCMRYFILSEELSVAKAKDIQAYISLYCESRNWLTSRGMQASVRHDNTNGFSSIAEVSFGASSTSLDSLSMQSNHIRRVDALSCVHQMLHLRGCYGPRLVDDILAPVDDMIAVVVPMPSDNVSDYEKDLIDMDQFLELFIFELLKHDEDLSVISSRLFSSDIENSMVASIASISSNEFNSSSKILLQSLQYFMQYMLSFDPLRSGYIEMKHFKNAMNLFVDSNAINQELSSDYILVITDIKLRCCNNIDADDVCYVDLIALLLSAAYQDSVFPYTLTCKWISSALNSVKRGIDKNYADDLIYYMGRAKCYAQEVDKFWMCRKRVFESKPAVQSEYDKYEKLLPDESVSSTANTNSSFYEGYWRCDSNVNPASDDPGTLTIIKALLQMPTSVESSLPVDGKVWRSQVKGDASVTMGSRPMVLETNRKLTTIHGEVCAISIASAHEKVPLSTIDLTSSIPILENQDLLRSSTVLPPTSSQVIDGLRLAIDGIGHEFNDETNKLTESLFASSSNFLSQSFTSNTFDDDIMNKRKELIENISDYQKSKKDRLEYEIEYRNSEIRSAIENRRNGNKSEKSLKVRRLTDSDQLSDVIRLFSNTNSKWGVSEGYDEQCVEMSYLLYNEMQKEEELVLREMKQMEVRSALLRHEKYAREKALRKDMKNKEREYNVFKQEAENARDGRRQAARELQQKILLEEMAEKAAKEEAEKRLIEERKQERAEKANERKNKAALEAERLRELNELLGMRNEEKYSIESEKEFQEQIKR